MCGLFGFDIADKGIDPFKRGILAHKLAVLNDERGGHSWGFAALHEGALTISKGLGDMGPEAHSLAGHCTLFAHTRWATHGAKNLDNAHPFQIDGVTGSHNGILDNHRELCEIYNRDFDVDSMHLFAHLAEGRDFKEIEGYGAITWHEEKHEERIYLARLDGGELAVYGLGDQEAPLGIVWSSSEIHLLEALESSGLDAFEFEVEEGKVYFVQGGKLYVDRSRELHLSPRTALVSWSDYKWGGEGWDEEETEAKDGSSLTEFEAWLANKEVVRQNKTQGRFATLDRKALENLKK